MKDTEKIHWLLGKIAATVFPGDTDDLAKMPCKLKSLLGPLPLEDEKRMQAEVEKAFLSAKADFEREVRLSSRDIPDFVLGGDLAVELKISGSPRSIYRQCLRYLEHERINGLVLLTAKTMSLPETVNGKPCLVITLGESWL